MSAHCERPRTARGRAGALALAGLALAVFAAHAAFYRQDTAPPVWDEALHLLLAVRFHDFLGAPSLEAGRALREAWSFYPPLYHAGVGALFGVVGVSPLAARLVNVGLLAVLAWGTFHAGRALFGGRAGALAAALVVTFPVVTRLTRMAMTDLGLAAWTAAAVGCLLGTGLRSRRQAALLGLLLAAGLLTKWTFPAFVAGPLFVWALPGGPAPPGRRVRLAWAAALGGLLAAPWYAANAPVIAERGRFLAGLGPAQENPHGWNLANALAYPRVVFDTFVAAPERWLLLGSAAAALLCLASGRMPRGPVAGEGAPPRTALALLLAWLVVPWVAMTAISNKDPRFVLPLVAPLAVLCAWGLLAIPVRAARIAAACALSGYLVLVHMLAVLPEVRRARALAALPPAAAATLWADLRGLARPADPGFPAAAVVHAIHRRLTPVAPYASLEVVPDLSTVNPNSLAWLARRTGFRLDTHHPLDVAEVDAGDWDYVLVKPGGHQGASHTTRASAAIARRILAAPDAFVVVEELGGPDGPLVLLRAIASTPPAHLRAGLIEPGSPSARWHLGTGWGRPEPAGRWALGRLAVVRVSLEPGRFHEMEVDLAPFPGLPRPQVVTVRYREAVVASWQASHPGVFRAELPAGLPTGAIDELSLVFAEAARPSALGLSADPRELAVFVRRIRFDPRD
jgi:4-amino-4-deoxy-L-arabinose transferase-like glycosyltransferase